MGPARRGCGRLTAGRLTAGSDAESARARRPNLRPVGGRQRYGGRFEPLDQVAATGRSWTFRATDLERGDEVLLEVFRPGVGEVSEAGRRQFAALVRRLAAVDHAGVAAPRGVGWSAGSYWVATAVPAGERLGDRLRRTGPLGAPDAAEVGLEVSEALVAAHAAGLAHGSLTVDEVVLAADDGRAVVTGFCRAPGADPIADVSALGDLVADAAGLDEETGTVPARAELGEVVSRLRAAGREGGLADATAARADLATLARRAGGVEPGAVAAPSEPGLLRSLPRMLRLVVVALAVVALGGLAVFVLGLRDDEPKGPATVPEVVGVDQDLAVERLRDAGLGHRVQSQQDDAAAGTVVEQLPAAGAGAREGDEVTLVVSTGPEQVAVPEVVGLPATEARAALEAAGFVVEEQQQERTGFTSGQVATQTPGGGNRAEAGSTVAITVVP